MKVLVAIDESDGSLYALNWALHKFFRSLGESPAQSNDVVTLVHVQTPLQTFIPVIPAAAAVYASPAIIESVRKSQKENAELIMQKALQLCKDTNATTETMVLQGDPNEMICQTTEQMEFDMLIIGSRGLGKIKRALLGSVSDYCAHNANCPILIVKPPQESQK